MKFKGKKAIMAAALSAIVAASSFGTTLTANAEDDYYWINHSTYCEPGAIAGTLEYGDWYIPKGKLITVIVTPGPNSYISRFTVEGMDKFGYTETLIYEVNTISYEPIKYEFEMPACAVHIYAYFGLSPTPAPDPTPTPTPEPTPAPEPTPEPTPTPTWKKGDANCDGRVNAEDATAILKHTVGIKELSYVGFVNADMNQDGKVTAADATAILKLLVSKP